MGTSILSNSDVVVNILRKTVSNDQVLLATHGHDRISGSAALQCYLEGVFAVYVVIRLNWCDDITGQRDATEHSLLSAVCGARTHTYTHIHICRILLQASEATISDSAKIFLMFTSDCRFMNSRKISDIIHGWLLVWTGPCGSMWHEVACGLSIIQYD